MLNNERKIMKNSKNVEEKLPKIEEIINYIIKKGSEVHYLVDPELNNGSDLVTDTFSRDVTFHESWLIGIKDCDCCNERTYNFKHQNPDIKQLMVDFENVRVEKISPEKHKKNVKEDKKTNHMFYFFEQLKKNLLVFSPIRLDKNGQPMDIEVS